MTEKVKITQEQAYAIKSHINNMGADGILNETLELKYKTYTENSVTTPELFLLSRMEITELSRALYSGYEVEPEYKIGDWVAYEYENKIYLGQIKEFWSHGFIKTNILAGCKAEQAFEKQNIRYATPEEIKAEKERRLWTKLGREVGEFRAGDVRLINDYSSVYTTATVVAKNEYDNSELTGFYPVESFISFESK